MEKENKISKGIITGCLAMVLALTIWVININNTYSTDATATPSCKTLNGIKYFYLTNNTSGEHGCCPFSSTMKVAYEAVGNETLKCFSEMENGTCPAGYSKNGSYGNCIASLGVIGVDEACYYCTGSSVTGTNYLWSSGTPSATCNGGNWEIQENITSSDKCVTPTQNYEVTFELNGGKLYENGQFKSRNVISLSKLDYSIYSSVKYGSNFAGWDFTEDCTSPKNTGVVDITKKTTVYACYYVREIDTDYYYEVYLNASKKDNVSGIVYNNGVSTNKNEFVISNVKENSTLNLSKYTAKISGYTFKGWSKTSSCQSFVTNPKIDGGTRFYACYDKDEEIENPKVYKVTFDPDGGIWTSDGSTGTKVKEYTSRKYFSDLDLGISKNGYTFGGWKNQKGEVFNLYVDASDDKSTLKAVWIPSSSSGETPVPDPDIGDESKCEYIYKDSCELAFDGYNCVKDSNNCYVKGTKKDNSSPSTGETCDFESKNACEIVNEGYNCKLDSNGCYVKGTKKNTGGNTTGGDNNDNIDNPQTGSSLIYIAIIIGIITLGYTIYYTYNLKRNEVK